jgi:hypothetical protein
MLVVFLVFHGFSFCGKGWGYSLRLFALGLWTSARGSLLASIRFPPESLGPKQLFASVKQIVD